MVQIDPNACSTNLRMPSDEQHLNRIANTDNAGNGEGGGSRLGIAVGNFVDEAREHAGCRRIGGPVVLSRGREAPVGVAAPASLDPGQPGLLERPAKVMRKPSALEPLIRPKRRSAFERAASNSRASTGFIHPDHVSESHGVRECHPKPMTSIR